ncbi:MAG: tetratricopeptide repeat protein [Bacteroidota bacterium]|nr:tetratricopeptide repeat protein [Bacteroidota bacterium]MDP4234191.1 tetratricopeptide repeat protein [Bacteroidota bacterium]MDP4243743.1 tetratricopeptide repeat protein [Bacteroidota bacterium]MDP4287892.1 tetratricopeptide repeat protein [Bacteroidota bacterium]
MTHSPNPTSAELREALHKCEGRYLTDAEGAIAEVHKVLSCARSSGDSALIAMCLMELGRAHRQQPDLLKAGDYFREALGMFTSLGDGQGIPLALQGLGTVHSASGNLPEAVRCFNGALPLAQSNQDWYTVQRIFNSWGIVSIRSGDYAGAMHTFGECLASLADHPDEYLESSVLANIGAIFERSEEYETAAEHFERSLAIARRLQDDRQVTSTLVFLANTRLHENRLEEARICIEEALQLSTKHNLQDLKSQILISLAELTLLGSTPGDALRYLTEARELVEATPNKIHLQKVEHAIGATYLQLGDLEKAEIALGRALELAERVASPQLLYETNLLYSEIATKQLDYKRANEYLHAALKQHELLHSETNRQAVRALEVRMALNTYRRRRDARNQETNELTAAVAETQTESSQAQ